MLGDVKEGGGILGGMENFWKEKNLFIQQT